MKIRSLYQTSVPVILVVLSSFLVVPLARGADWTITFQASIPEPSTDSGFLSFNLNAGISDSATDGYDGAFDVIALLAGPLQVSISHEGDSAYPPHLQDLWTDLRSESFPQTWTIRVRSFQSQHPISIEWSSPLVFQTNSCRIQSLQLIDEGTGLPVDLLGGASLSYSSSGSLSLPDGRDFTLSANSIPQNSPSPPTGLFGKRKGQKVKLKWDKLENFDITGVRVWRRLEGDSGWVLLGEVGSKDRDFKDNDLQPGLTYFYSLSAMGTNGCESLRSGEVVVGPR